MSDPLLLVLYMYSSEETISRSCAELVLVFYIRINFTAGEFSQYKYNRRGEKP